jgi:hypothetical protein
LFRRSRSETPPVEAGPGAVEDPTAPKGRPTPKRREAEAAAKAKAKATATGGKGGKGGARGDRSARAQEGRRIRQGIKEGDERYLPARDRGPVRRFVRDYVDARLCMAEFAVPLMLASLLLSSVGFRAAGSGVLNATILVVLLDSLLLRFRLRRELKRRFPSESTKGTTFYALVRSLQLRFMRLPKPQVKLGQRLPERY